MYHLCYFQTPRDMLKIISLLVIAAIPFIGNFLVAIGYVYTMVIIVH